MFQAMQRVRRVEEGEEQDAQMSAWNFDVYFLCELLYITLVYNIQIPHQHKT